MSTSQDPSTRPQGGETQRLNLSWVRLVPRVIGWLLGIAGVVAIERGSFWWTVGGAVTLAVIKVVSDRGYLRIRASLRRAQGELAHVNNELKTSFGSAIGPIARLAGRINTEADPNRRERLRGQAIQTTVEAAARLAGPRGETRASFFRFEPESDSFHPQAHHGRHDPPTTVFTPDRPNGAHVLYLVNSRQSALCLNTERPEGGVPVISGKPYKTYICAPVFAGETTLGILTVDATQPGHLDRRHKAIAEALAQLLGCALTGGL